MVKSSSKSKKKQNLKKIEKGIGIKERPEELSRRVELSKLFDPGTYAKLGEYLRIYRPSVTERDLTVEAKSERPKPKRKRKPKALLRDAVKKKNDEKSKSKKKLSKKIKAAKKKKDKLGKKRKQKAVKKFEEIEERRTPITIVPDNIPAKPEKTELETVSIENQEEWRAGIEQHKIEVSTAGSEKFVADIVEVEVEKKKKGFFSRVIDKIKGLFSKRVEVHKEKPKDPCENIEEVKQGVIRYGADELVSVVAIDSPEWEIEMKKERALKAAEEAEKTRVSDDKTESESLSANTNKSGGEDETLPKDNSETDNGDVIDFSPLEEGKKLVTGIDKLYFIVKKKENVKLDEAAKNLSVTKKKANEWAKILEDQEMITIHYPPVGEPSLTPKVKSKGDETES